jgi:hypothetical protein
MSGRRTDGTDARDENSISPGKAAGCSPKETLRVAATDGVTVAFSFAPSFAAALCRISGRQICQVRLTI